MDSDKTVSSQSVRFRRKPLVVEAIHWQPNVKPKSLPQWLWSLLVHYPERFNEQTGILAIEHGQYYFVYAKPGDWIIKCCGNGLIVCPPDRFEEEYDRI